MAARQHGVVIRSQLLAAGFTNSAVATRLARGRLHSIFPGVYAVGHRALSHRGRWMAAVLACGEGAVLSHRSAAELFNLLPAGVGPIHVTVPFSRRPKHAGMGYEVVRFTYRQVADEPAQVAEAIRTLLGAGVRSS